VTVAAFVTDFADQAVLMPSAIAVAIGFGVAGWYRGALAWSGVLACTWMSILLLKLAYLLCGSLWVEGLHSPSGHTASAAAAAGGFFGLIVRRRGGDWRWTILISAGLAIAIGLSRLALHVHTGLDVLVAGVLGVCSAIILVLLAGAPPARLRLSPIITALAVIIPLLHGSQASAEAAIQRIAASEFWDDLNLGVFARQNCRTHLRPFAIDAVKTGQQSDPPPSDKCRVEVTVPSRSLY
jgi:membrane-associated phospholipid phosphatase